MGTLKGTVVRQRSTPLGTPGRLVMENGFSCDTLELPWHDNERGRSCTKADTYYGRVWWSPTLQRLVVRFADANGRKDCLIHNGNFAADEFDQDGDGKPEVTQVHGCTEVGEGYGEIVRRDTGRQWGILRSVPTLQALLKSLENGETVRVGPDGYASGFHNVVITYSWAAGAAPEEV